MTDYTELKQLATRIVEVQTSQDVPISKLFDDFDAATSPEVVLALIAENDSARKHWQNESNNVQALMAEVLRLKAENAGLKTGYEAYERVNAELKAEIVSLKDEISTDDKIIADRDRLLNLFECPAHGQCVPYAMEKVAALRNALAECANSLHGEMLQKFGGQLPDDMHPVTRREYDRDMAEVAGYRVALGQGEQS